MLAGPWPAVCHWCVQAEKLRSLGSVAFSDLSMSCILQGFIFHHFTAFPNLMISEKASIRIHTTSVVFGSYEFIVILAGSFEVSK